MKSALKILISSSNDRQKTKSSLMLLTEGQHGVDFSPPFYKRVLKFSAKKIYKSLAYIKFKYYTKCVLR